MACGRRCASVVYVEIIHLDIKTAAFATATNGTRHATHIIVQHPLARPSLCELLVLRLMRFGGVCHVIHPQHVLCHGAISSCRRVLRKVNKLCLHEHEPCSLRGVVLHI